MGLMSQMSDEERYRTAEEWRVTCQACGESTTFPGVGLNRLRGRHAKCASLILLCTNCDTSHVTFGFVKGLPKAGRKSEVRPVVPQRIVLGNIYFNAAVQLDGDRGAQVHRPILRRPPRLRCDGGLAVWPCPSAARIADAPVCVCPFHLLTVSFFSYLQMTRRVAVVMARRSSYPFLAGTASTLFAAVPCTQYTPTSSCTRSCPTLSTSLTCRTRWTRFVSFLNSRGIAG